MKNIITTVILLGAVLSLFLHSQRLVAQQCQDEEAMVEDFKKGLNELVETTRKETLAQFEKAYHQKSCLSKLSLCLSMLDELVGCLEKASQDSAAPKEKVDAYKTKLETYTKLKDKIEGDRKALKASDDAKAAKSLIEKFDLGN